MVYSPRPRLNARFFGVVVGEGGLTVLHRAGVLGFRVMTDRVTRFVQRVACIIQRVAGSVLGVVHDIAAFILPAAPADAERLAEGVKRTIVPGRVDRAAHSVTGGEQDTAEDQHHDGEFCQKFHVHAPRFR